MGPSQGEHSILTLVVEEPMSVVKFPPLERRYILFPVHWFLLQQMRVAVGQRTDVDNGWPGEVAESQWGGTLRHIVAKTLGRSLKGPLRVCEEIKLDKNK